MVFNKLSYCFLAPGIALSMHSCSNAEIETKKPNILFAISDDQSFVHTSYTGSRFINTPAFDRIASEGVFFTNCYAASPGCAPSRSGLVTGRHHWQNEQSGQHGAAWLKKYIPFTDVLELNGYATGRTGKGVTPFKYADSENDSLWRFLDAAGKEHSKLRYQDTDSTFILPSNKLSELDYFANFRHFMENVKGDRPFFFWYGSQEPHRDYEKDSWKRTGKTLDMVDVPGFLPDNEVTRGDLLDYAIEIEWFDSHLHKMLQYLEETGELENTIVIVTSDNGMPFPRAKANSFEYGVHVPLAIRYPKEFKGGRTVSDLVSFIDFAPTILEIAKIEEPGMLPITGKSFLKMLEAKSAGKVSESNHAVFFGRERHSSSRYENLGYPQRAIRKGDYLLIWNLKPERWPAGDPQALDSKTKEPLPVFGIDEEGVHHSDWAFTDIDASPSKSVIIENHQQDEMKPYFELAHAKRPEFELYNVMNDPFNLNNLYSNDSFKEVGEELKKELIGELNRTGDPRVTGTVKEIFDIYPRYTGPMRFFPEHIDNTLR